MGRLMVRYLPDGRRGEIQQVDGELVRLLFYTAEPGHVYASRDYASIAAARVALNQWTGQDGATAQQGWRTGAV